MLALYEVLKSGESYFNCLDEFRKVRKITSKLQKIPIVPCLRSTKMSGMYTKFKSLLKFPPSKKIKVFPWKQNHVRRKMRIISKLEQFSRLAHNLEILREYCINSTCVRKIEICWKRKKEKQLDEKKAN